MMSYFMIKAACLLFKKPRDILVAVLFCSFVVSAEVVEEKGKLETTLLATCSFFFFILLVGFGKQPQCRNKKLPW